MARPDEGPGGPPVRALVLGRDADAASLRDALALEGDAGDDQLAALVDAVRDRPARFRVTAAWRDRSGRSWSRVAGALDKPGRPLWLISQVGDARDGWVICASSTPTEWFRRLAGLLRAPHELEHGAGDLTEA